jgi:ATP-dependent helicase/nuclease subunit B
LADEKGSEVQPSFLVSQLKTLFTDLRSAEGEKYFGSNNVLNKSDLTGLLALRLGRDNLSPADDMDAKCKWLLDIAIKDYDLSKVKSAIDYKNTARLDSLPAQDILSTSATKLRSFASCPYKYFVKHILELQERRVFELEPFSLGLFFHKVLELLFNHLKRIDHSIYDADSDMLERFTDNAVAKLLIEDSFLKSFNARTKHNSFIILSAAQMVKDAVLEFSQIASAGSFLQIASEIGFGDKFPLPAVEIKLENDKKLRIEGKIDRIDVVSQADTNYCLVVDYKTSETAINWSLFSAGLDLQLPIYLLAAKNQTIEKYKNLIPLGGFYFHIQVFSKSADLGDIGGKGQKIIRKPRGIFNGEYFKLFDNKTSQKGSLWYSFYITKEGQPFGNYEKSSALYPEHFSAVLSFAENKIKEFGRKIFSSTIDVNPYKYGKKIACTYCPYKSLCRFDWQVNDYAQVMEVSKTEFFRQLNELD